MDDFRGLSAKAIVARCGHHPAHALEITFDDDAQLGRWLIAVALTGRRIDEASWIAAVRSLAGAGLCDPKAIALADPAVLEAALAKPAVELAGADVVAHKLVRLCGALVEKYRGSLDALAGECDGLEELGSRLARLAPGFGPASVARFLRPLRERWHAAREIPLHPDARAAAICLGWLSDTEDIDGEPSALRATLHSDADPPPFTDIESALERLGATSCRRNRTRRCLLADACPSRQ